MKKIGLCLNLFILFFALFAFTGCKESKKDIIQDQSSNFIIDSDNEIISLNHSINTTPEKGEYIEGTVLVKTDSFSSSLLSDINYLSCSSLYTGSNWYQIELDESEDTVEVVEKAQLQHNYEFKEIVWTNFNAKAVYVCANDNTHVVEYDCEVSSVVTTTPTCSVEGIMTYTASYDGHKSTKTENLDKDFNNHELVHHDAKPTSCLEIGWDAYDTCNNCEYSTYAEKPIIEHSWLEVGYKWSEDYTSCTATRVCNNDIYVKKTLSILPIGGPGSIDKSDKDVIDVSSYFPGSDTFKYEYHYNGKGYCLIRSGEFRLYNYDGNGSELVITPIDKNTHFLSCSLNIEGIKVTISPDEKSISIKNISNSTMGNIKIINAFEILYSTYEHHFETETVNSTGSVTQNQDCTHPELTVYTAEFKSVIFETQEIELETKSVLNHNYEYEIVWTDFTAKIIYTCTNDQTHTLEFDCIITDEVTTVATCSINGVKTYTATYDGHSSTKTEDLGKDPNNHDLIHHNATSAPLCTVVCWDAYDTCKNCEYSTYVGKVGNHSYSFVEIVWTDFTAKAVYVCLNDNSHVEEHECTVSSEVTTVATCSANGIRIYTASYDGHKDTKTENLGKNPNNHDIEHHDAKTPTCTEVGWDAYDSCKNCKYTTYVEKAALNHDIEHHDAKAPTCTEVGWDQYDTCSKCEYSTYVEKSALQHNYEFKEIVWTNFNAKAVYVCANDNTHVVEYDCEVSSAVTTVPTCSVEGIMTYTASHDDHKDTKTENIGKNANNHGLVHHEGKAPTCTEIGFDAYDTCKNCDYTTYVEKPALQHNYVFSEIVWESETAKAVYVCVNNYAHKEEFDCVIAKTVLKPATSSEMGIMMLVATYDGHTSSIVVDIPIDENVKESGCFSSIGISIVCSVVLLCGAFFLMEKRKYI